MNENPQETREGSGSGKARRGPAKSFPLMAFEDVLALPKAIAEHAPGDSIRRVTLFKQMNRSADSGPSRQLVTNAGRYGLTTGSYKADELALTAEGRLIVAPETAAGARLEAQYGAAIGRVEPFVKVHEKLSGRKVPSEAVLEDEFGALGITAADRPAARSVFMANVRFLGLVEEWAGGERFVSLADRTAGLERGGSLPLPEGDIAPAAPPTSERGSTPTNAQRTPVAESLPNLHIDVQVHIDASAAPEQIEAVFASMAKHLYGRVEQPNIDD